MNTFLASLYILIGTYTGGESRGIYVYKFDPETARTEYVGLTPIENPSYITSWGSTVYAVSENGDAPRPAQGGGASAFRFVNGALELINSAPTGGSPCNIATNGSLVVTANYGGGDVSVFGVREDGGLTGLRQSLRLSEFAFANSQRPPVGGSLSSHIHCVKFSPDGRFLFAADLGTDRIARWDVRQSTSSPLRGTPPSQGGEIDEASLKTFDVPAGSGPRHFVFSHDGESVYLINELSGTVVAFDYNGGDLVQRQIIDADPADGSGSADIVLSPDGRHLYASNRLKNDGVAIFSIEQKKDLSSERPSGKAREGVGEGAYTDVRDRAEHERNEASGSLSRQGYKTTGEHPRNLSMSPDGRFMLVSCRDSDVVQIFAVDQKTGALTPTSFAIDIDAPVCVHFIRQ